MAIVLKNNSYDLKLDSKTIIGVMGKKYDVFISSLNGKDVYYIDKKVDVSEKKVSNVLNLEDKKAVNILKEFNLGEEFINKRINELSHSENKLLKYALLALSNKMVLVIDEPFLDLDYDNKKKVQLLINRLIKDHKTVIIGSSNSNIVYSLCKKVLFINENDYCYSDINVFQNIELLRKYHINPPDLVKFVSLVREKNIKLRYSYDIRDLIKDVYRNVP